MSKDNFKETLRLIRDLEKDGIICIMTAGGGPSGVFFRQVY